MKKSKPVTFDDIAKYTHFSKTTISRYFNNPESLTPQNQKIIAEALKKLDYRANKVARILANGKTEFIGILMPDLYHHFFSRILNEILGTYEEFGYKFLVFVGNSKEEVERRYIQELLAYQIEGLLVLSYTIPSESLAQLQVPVVTIEREDAQVCSVNTDNYLGGQQAAALLADCQSAGQQPALRPAAAARGDRLSGHRLPGPQKGRFYGQRHFGQHLPQPAVPQARLFSRRLPAGGLRQLPHFQRIGAAHQHHRPAGGPDRRRGHHTAAAADAGIQKEKRGHARPHPPDHSPGSSGTADHLPPRAEKRMKKHALPADRACFLFFLGKNHQFAEQVVDDDNQHIGGDLDGQRGPVEQVHPHKHDGQIHHAGS